MRAFKPATRGARIVVFASLLSILAVAGFSGRRSSLSGKNEGPELPYAEIAESLRIEGLKSEGAFASLERLTRLAPQRLTGSPGFASAQELMRREMEGLGLSLGVSRSASNTGYAEKSSRPKFSTPRRLPKPCASPLWV